MLELACKIEFIMEPSILFPYSHILSYHYITVVEMSQEKGNLNKVDKWLVMEFRFVSHLMPAPVEWSEV